jgi:hypothetical protein
MALRALALRTTMQTPNNAEATAAQCSRKLRLRAAARADKSLGRRARAGAAQHGCKMENRQ